jgi:ubiquitin carboxyl-terminal hydrolase 5/13
MNVCKHLENLKHEILSFQTNIFKDECTNCFDTPFSNAGLDVCLTCFNGACLEEFNHSLLHYEKTNHPLVANIKKKKLVGREKNCMTFLLIVCSFLE